ARLGRGRGTSSARATRKKLAKQRPPATARKRKKTTSRRLVTTASVAIPFRARLGNNMLTKKRVRCISRHRAILRYRWSGSRSLFKASSSSAPCGYPSNLRRRPFRKWWGDQVDAPGALLLAGSREMVRRYPPIFPARVAREIAQRPFLPVRSHRGPRQSLRKEDLRGIMSGHAGAFVIGSRL